MEDIVNNNIKLIMLDLVGVLVFEREDVLNDKEDKIERLFGPNLSDEEYLNNKINIIYDKNELIDITKNIINKLYYVKDKDIFKKIKDKYNNVKIIIATNHVSYVKDFIINNFNSSYLDDIIISSEIHLIKPNYDFYKYILDKYNINSNNVLFLDDNKDNIETAGEMGINTILVNKNMNIYDEICKYMIKYE
jgi:HAD hydrolase, family IA, variant 3